MATQLVAEQQSTLSGLRAVDPRRDLNQVADLIEEAFSGELEAGGLSALRDLRLLSHMGPLVGLMARSDPMMEDMLGGFVWVEQGRVVGNVTLQRMDSYGSRWQIANVAVAKGYRGRGIGRALMEAALERISDRRGSWAVLQVRADNVVALDLYKSLGFEAVTREISLRAPGIPKPLPPADPPEGLRLYQPEEWRARHDLETTSHSALDLWWRPVRSNKFYEGVESRAGEYLWNLLGRNTRRRWVVPGTKGLVAYLGVDGRRWQGEHSIAITVHPCCRGELEDRLLSVALGFLADFPRWPIKVEHLGEHPQLMEALQRQGFRSTRDHLTMRRKMD
jgi:ribosomal protein S18 acetylase RimI-like enzyme